MKYVRPGVKQVWEKRKERRLQYSRSRGEVTATPACVSLWFTTLGRNNSLQGSRRSVMRNSRTQGPRPEPCLVLPSFLGAINDRHQGNSNPCTDQCPVTPFRQYKRWLHANGCVTEQTKWLKLVWCLCELLDEVNNRQGVFMSAVIHETVARVTDLSHYYQWFLWLLLPRRNLPYDIKGIQLRKL